MPVATGVLSELSKTTSSSEVTRASSCSHGVQALQDGASTPALLWAQRRQLLYTYVKIPDLDVNSLSINLTDHGLDLAATSKLGEDFRVSLAFFRRVESRTATWSVQEKGVLSGVQLILPKFWEWRYWPRLTRDAHSSLPISVDWKRWKRDDSEDRLTRVPQGEDEEWWDDEIAVDKPALFPDDEVDAPALPLLNWTTFEEHPLAFDLTAVVFFDRAMNPQAKVTRSTVRAMAAVAKYLAPHNASVACVDIVADHDLARAFHVQHSPTVKLLFPDGEMFDVNLNPLKSAKLLLQFLLRQRTPAIESVTSIAGAEKVFKDLDRVLLHLHDSKTSPALTRAFDLVAKEWRADSLGLVLQPVAMHRNVLAQMKLMNASDSAPAWLQGALTAMGAPQLESRFTGVLMVKFEEAVQRYTGPPLKRNLLRWSQQAQLNLIEPMSTASLQYIRSFKQPVLYVILAQRTVPASAAATAELRAIRAAAARFTGKVYFMWGLADVHAPIVEYLQCKNNGFTYAVLEDQVEDYKYCIETDAKNSLTEARVTRLLDDYVAKRAKPDVMKSERAPDKNEGPVFKVVGSNLMETVMDASRDVVLHIYSASDDKWRDDEFVLEKVARDLEDVSTVFVGKLDGLKNQPSPDFPDLGYFPCTWMFPAHHKGRPLMFNATLGFTYDRLITWVQKTADLRFELDDEMVERRLEALGADGGSTAGVSFEALEQLYVAEQEAKVERRKKRKQGAGAMVSGTSSHLLDFDAEAPSESAPAVNKKVVAEVIAQAVNPAPLLTNVGSPNQHSEL